jgi:cytochrome c556
LSRANDDGDAMRYRLMAAGICMMLAAGFAADSIAQAKPEDLVQNRQSAMQLQGKYLYSIVPMARNRIPYDAGIVARNVGYLQVLLQMPWDDFQPSTQGVKSRALPAIFKQPEKFKAAQDAVQKEVAKLADTVKGGDEAAIKAGILSLNDTCGNCHDNFREKQ